MQICRIEIYPCRINRSSYVADQFKFTAALVNSEWNMTQTNSALAVRYQRTKRACADRLKQHVASAFLIGLGNIHAATLPELSTIFICLVDTGERFQIKHLAPINVRFWAS